MKQYFSMYIWDYVFTLTAAVGLALNVFASFVISPELTGDFLQIILIAGAVIAALFFLGTDRRVRRIGSILLGCGLLLLVFWMLRRGLLVETEMLEESRPLFHIVLVITCVICWVFTRGHKSCVVFTVADFVICGAYGFLEYPVSVPGLFLMAAGLLLEIFFRGFCSGLDRADYGRFSFSHMTIQSLLVVVAIASLAGGVYYSLIRPLHPPVADLKLITEQMSWDVVEKIGISSSLETENQDLTSNNLNDTLHKTNQKDDTQSDSSREQSDSEDSESKNDDMQKKSQNRQMAFSVSYDEQTPYILLLILLVLAVLASPFAVKGFLLSRHRARIAAMLPAEGVAYLYHYFLRKLSLVHLARPQTATVLEYAHDNARELRHFDTQGGVSFGELSDIYNRMVYGRIEPSEWDYDRFKEYYDAFRPNIRRRLGKLRYAICYWIL